MAERFSKMHDLRLLRFVGIRANLVLISFDQRYSAKKKRCGNAVLTCSHAVA